MKLRKKDRKNLIKLIISELGVSEGEASAMFDQMPAREKKSWVRKIK